MTAQGRFPLFWTVGDAGPYCCGLSGLAITGAHRKISSPFYGSNAVAFAVSFASFLEGSRKEDIPPPHGSNAVAFAVSFASFLVGTRKEERLLTTDRTPSRSPFLLLLFLWGQEKKIHPPQTASRTVAQRRRSCSPSCSPQRASSPRTRSLPSRVRYQLSRVRS